MLHGAAVRSFRGSLMQRLAPLGTLQPLAESAHRRYTCHRATESCLTPPCAFAAVHQALPEQ
eukprot:4381201-Alexandrium_andersonii.AAC.1